MENLFELPQFLCLENLVGISRKECDCFTGLTDQSKKVSVQKSETGLYIDEHDGAVGCLFLEKATCFDGDVWDRLILARKESVLQMIMDCSVNLDQRYMTIKPYAHHIGELGYSGLLNLPSGKQSVKFKTRNLQGAKIKLVGVGLIAKLLNGSTLETVRIKFTNLTKNTIIKEFDFDVKMRQTSYGVEPDATMYDMPNFTLECDGSEYQISYELDTTKILVYDNVLTCRCGGVRNELSRYYEVLPDGNARGLLFNAQYICDENYLLCALSNSIPTVRFLIAEGIRCLTMYKFLNNTKGKASHGATIENVLNLTQLDGLIESFSMKYNQVISDIQAKTLTMGNFGCFTCNDYNHAKREGIMVSDPFVEGYKNIVSVYNEFNEEIGNNYPYFNTRSPFIT